MRGKKRKMESSKKCHFYRERFTENIHCETTGTVMFSFSVVCFKWCALLVSVAFCLQNCSSRTCWPSWLWMCVLDLIQVLVQTPKTALCSSKALWISTYCKLSLPFLFGHTFPQCSWKAIQVNIVLCIPHSHHFCLNWKLEDFP